MEQPVIRTMIVAQLINKVSAFCGNEMDITKFGREDVNLIELACDRTHTGDSSDDGKYCDMFTKDIADLRLKLCDTGLVLAYDYFLCHCRLFLKTFL
jgi:hypothetical protein